MENTENIKNEATAVTAEADDRIERLAAALVDRIYSRDLDAVAGEILDEIMAGADEKLLIRALRTCGNDAEALNGFCCTDDSELASRAWVNIISRYSKYALPEILEMLRCELLYDNGVFAILADIVEAATLDSERGDDLIEKLKIAVNPETSCKVIKEYFDQVFACDDPHRLVDALRVCASYDYSTNLLVGIDWRNDSVNAVFGRLFGVEAYKNAIIARAEKEWSVGDIEDSNGFLDVVCCRSYLNKAFDLAAEGVEAVIAEGIADPESDDKVTEPEV